MKIEDCVVVLQQDVEARVKRIDSVVEEYQKGWNGQRSDRAPTFHPILSINRVSR